MIAEINDARILKFLENRFQAADVSALEAVETLVLSMNHLQAIPELVEMAKVSSRRRQRNPLSISLQIESNQICLPLSLSLSQMFLHMPFSKSNTYVWHSVMLTYGSLVYKHCAYYNPCPVAAVQVREEVVD